MATGLSIVIPTLNETNYLPKLLESISSQDFPGKLQVIVVDGQSSDDTVAKARAFKDKIGDLIVLQAKRDIGHQRNAGAKRAKYEYLLFIDADALLPPNFLNELAVKIQAKEHVVYAFMQRFRNMSPIDRLFYGIGCVFLAGFLLTKKPVTKGDCILTDRKNFDKVNGFKENVLIGEDVDFGKRSIKAGAEFRFFFRPYIIASLRRARDMGRTKMFLFYVPAFLRMAKHGPIYKGEMPDDAYRFGHYDENGKPTAT